MDASVSDGTARRSLLDQLGPRAQRRPVPRAGAFVGAAGGALLVAGLGLLAIDAGGAFGNDFGDGGSFERMPGILIGLLALAAGLLVLQQRKHGAIASAATVLVGAAIPGVLVLLVVRDDSGSLDTVLGLSALAWTATYLFGPGRGRAVLLGLALFGGWSCAMSMVGGALPLSPVGLFTFQAELGSDSYPSTVYAEDFEDFEHTSETIAGADEDDSSDGFSIEREYELDPADLDDLYEEGYEYDDYDDDDDGGYESYDEVPFGPGFGAFQGPDLATMGAVSLAIGAAYLWISRALDRRGRRGMSMPFVVVGLLAVVEGVVSFVFELHLRPGSVVVIAAGVALAVFGADTGRRFPAALGALAAVVGLGFLMLPDVDTPAAAGGMLLLAGAIAVSGGHVLGGLLKEGDEAAPPIDDAGPPSPGPEPTPSPYAPPAEEDPGVPVLDLEAAPAVRPARKAPAKQATPTKRPAAKKAVSPKKAVSKKAVAKKPAAKKAAAASKTTPAKVPAKRTPPANR